ncbi:hypothetical protein ACIQLK_01655 [Microbacterium sp. NPDC091382]|uniref:hypothetical protein n=1 Tax=Microbacterium sp. NPDC091382 TaxID=3364210 RepID=UPI003807A2DF
MSTLARTPAFKPGSLPRANLLPLSETRRREVRRLGRSWVTIGLGSLVVALLLIGGAFAMNVQAALRLVSANADTERVIAEIAELAPVSQAVAQRTELSGLITQAMSGDIAWRKAVATVTQALPAGVTVTDYALAAGQVPGSTAPDETVGAAGTVTVVSDEPISLVEATRALRGVDAILEVSVQTLAEEEGVYTYTVEVQLDQTIYSGAFAPEQTTETE